MELINAIVLAACECMLLGGLMCSEIAKKMNIKAESAKSTEEKKKRISISSNLEMISVCLLGMSLGMVSALMIANFYLIW